MAVETRLNLLMVFYDSGHEDTARQRCVKPPHVLGRSRGGKTIRGVVVPSDSGRMGGELVVNWRVSRVHYGRGWESKCIFAFIQIWLSPGQRALSWGWALEILSVCGIDGDELVAVVGVVEAHDVLGVFGGRGGRIA